MITYTIPVIFFFFYLPLSLPPLTVTYLKQQRVMKLDFQLSARAIRLIRCKKRRKKTRKQSLARR